MAATIDQSQQHVQHPAQSHADRPTNINDASDANITPPRSANGKTGAPDGVPAELSNLELDARATASASAIQPQSQQAASVEKEEAEEGVVPDHYYGGGKIPVFKPVSGFCDDWYDA